MLGDAEVEDADAVVGLEAAARRRVGGLLNGRIKERRHVQSAADAFMRGIAIGMQEAHGDRLHAGRPQTEHGLLERRRVTGDQDAQDRQLPATARRLRLAALVSGLLVLLGLQLWVKLRRPREDEAPHASRARAWAAPGARP